MDENNYSNQNRNQQSSAKNNPGPQKSSSSSSELRKPVLSKSKDENKKRQIVFVNLIEAEKHGLKIHVEFEEPVIFETFEDENGNENFYVIKKGYLKKAEKFPTNILKFCYRKHDEGRTVHNFNYDVKEIGETPFITLKFYDGDKNKCPENVQSLSLEEIDKILINRESESTVYYGDADEEKKKKS